MRPDDPGGPIRKTKHSGREPGLRHFQGSEIKLTNVARASLEELLEDYRDFLRIRGLQEWPKDHSHTRRLRELNRQPNADYETFKKGIQHPDPVIAANVMIGL